MPGKETVSGIGDSFRFSTEGGGIVDHCGGRKVDHLA